MRAGNICPVSHASARASAQADSTIFGFSTGSGLGIVIAALVTGGLISLYTQSIGWPFLVLFALSSLLVVTFINPKGLFLTATLIPLLYTLFLVITGVLNQYFQLSEGQSSLGRTQLVLVAYPFVQFFPVLLMVSVGVALVAAVRYRLLKRHNAEIIKLEEQERRRTSRSNERTSREATRSRQRTQRAYVAEDDEPTARTERPAREDRTEIIPAVKTTPRTKSTQNAQNAPSKQSTQSKPRSSSAPRKQRPERAVRPERHERPERKERAERGERVERPQRVQPTPNRQRAEHNHQVRPTQRTAERKTSQKVTVDELLARRVKDNEPVRRGTQRAENSQRSQRSGRTQQTPPRDGRRSVSRRLSDDLYGD